MMPYFWLAVMVIAIIVEALTFTLVSVWFVPGALVSLVLSFIPGIAPWVQIIVFLVVTVLLLIFVKPLTDKFLVKDKVATNADSLIGEAVIVTEEICNLEARGAVKARGQVWTARALKGDEIYAVGEVLHVVSIEGVKLICNK